MLPAETILAVFPRGGVVIRTGLFSRLKLHAATLAHAVALEAYNCASDMYLTDANCIKAAWILSHSADEVRELVEGGGRPISRSWMRAATRHLDKVRAAVVSLLSNAYITYVPPKREDGAVQEINSMGVSGHGYGWPLEIAEALCAEYGWSFETAIRTTVGQALALVSVKRGRHGEAGGPDYYDRIREQRMRDAGLIPRRL